MKNFIPGISNVNPLPSNIKFLQIPLSTVSTVSRRTMRTDLSLLYSFILSLSAKNAWNVRQRAGTSVTGNDLCAPDGRSPAQPPLLQSAVAVATPCWGPAAKKRIGYKAADMNTTVCSRSCEEGCTASGPAVCSYELPTRCLLCWRLWLQRYGTLASYRPARPGIHVLSAVLQKSNFPIHLTDRHEELI